MSWKIEYIFLIILSTLVDYFMGIKIHNTTSTKKRKLYLFFSLFVNLGLLFIFKYFNFFNSNLSSILSIFNITYTPLTLKVLLPVGISFYTFQTLSYTIDIYRKKLKPEKHLGIFAVYVSFFPQLVAGPIERATHLLAQFSFKQEKNKKLNYQNFKEGLTLMIIGYLKKIVIADNLSIIVNQIYNNPTNYSSIMLIIATIFFSFQIYADFSGYSSIARGISKILGYDLMINFKRPYLSKSISEFWSRWHISLSTWFRDYLYIPLGGNRINFKKTLINLLLVFAISGLWHGANITFLIWGILNGIYLIIEKIYNLTTKVKTIKKIQTKPKEKTEKKIEEKTKERTKERTKNFILNFLLIIKTYILTLFAWIFFRSNTINDAFFIIKKIFTSFNIKKTITEISLIDNYYLILGIIIITFTIIFEILVEKKKINLKNNKHLEIILAIIIFIIFIIGNFIPSEFIYFQF